MQTVQFSVTFQHRFCLLVRLKGPLIPISLFANELFLLYFELAAGALSAFWIVSIVVSLCLFEMLW